MESFKILFILTLFGLCSCENKGMKFILLSNNKPVLEILPSDIEYYDTMQVRGFIEIHEMRLREGFYSDSTISMSFPLKLECLINGKRYFKADHFYFEQSQPTLAVNFHFDPNCQNTWGFNESKRDGAMRGDPFTLYTNNPCNSIEFFHSKTEIEGSRDSYYEKKEYFQNYVDTARLAHELLLDPYYINALKESGVTIKSSPERESRDCDF